MTAVQWFFSELERMQYFIGNDMLEAYKQAKEMEKQKIFEAWDNGFDNGDYSGKYNENCEINCGEEYYNETFNK